MIGAVTTRFERLEIRSGGPADARAMAAHLVAGIAGYRDFAGPGWEPPPLERELGHMRGRLEAGAWSLVAFEDGELVGQVVVEPARNAAAGTAHLAGLFVSPTWWGTGLAASLHDSAVDAMRRGGFDRGRLFAASGQARARRFYERRSWRPAAEPFFEPPLGLELVEYRLPLRADDGRG
jgi:GNAT superfamily N-acetyltransferase